MLVKLAQMVRQHHFFYFFYEDNNPSCPTKTQRPPHPPPPLHTNTQKHTPPPPPPPPPKTVLMSDLVQKLGQLANSVVISKPLADDDRLRLLQVGQLKVWVLHHGDQVAICAWRVLHCDPQDDVDDVQEKLHRIEVIPGTTKTDMSKSKYTQTKKMKQLQEAKSTIINCKKSYQGKTQFI